MNEDSKAYKLGYSHGYKHGVEENPYDHDDINKVYYKQGYDSGCGDYCRDELDAPKPNPLVYDGTNEDECEEHANRMEEKAERE